MSDAMSTGAQPLGQATFTIRRRGFDADEVLEYLTRVAEHVESLEARLRAFESGATPVRTQASGRSQATDGHDRDPYAGASSHIAEMLRSIDEEADRLRKQAEAEAERIRLQGEHDAAVARARAETILAQARTDAERDVDALATRRGAIAEDLGELRDRVIDAIGKLDEVVDAASDDRFVIASTADDDANLPDVTSAAGTGATRDEFGL
jgi:cell division septum initiation protein DivIVA